MCLRQICACAYDKVHGKPWLAMGMVRPVPYLQRMLNLDGDLAFFFLHEFNKVSAWCLLQVQVPHVFESKVLLGSSRNFASMWRSLQYCEQNKKSARGTHGRIEFVFVFFHFVTFSILVVEPNSTYVS